MGIEATKHSVQSVEGSPVVLSCTYSSSAYNLQWYRQYPGSTPEFLLLSAPDTGHVVRAQPEDPRLDISINNPQVDLKISSAKTTDSALYFCALQPTLTKKALTAVPKPHCFSKLT